MKISPKCQTWVNSFQYLCYNKRKEISAMSNLFSL